MKKHFQLILALLCVLALALGINAKYLLYKTTIQ